MKRASILLLLAGLFQLLSAAEEITRFDKSTDLLLAQFDCKPDADDIQAIAALGSILHHPDFRSVNTYGVAGAVGTQGGKYIRPNTLFESVFGKKTEIGPTLIATGRPPLSG